MIAQYQFLHHGFLPTHGGQWGYLDRGEPAGEVAPYLSHSLSEWTRKNPQMRLRLIVPINRDGDTAELHAWYDQVLFPDTSEMAKPDR